MNRRPFISTLQLGILWLALALCGCQASEESSVQTERLAPVELEATVDKAVATTGDTLRFEIRIDALKGLTLEYQEPGSQIMGLRILDSGLEREGEFSISGETRVRQTHWYTLRGDLVGSYILPAMQLSYSDGARIVARSAPLRSSSKFNRSYLRTAAPKISKGLSRLSGLSAPCLGVRSVS